jgi:hypothetical protein
MKQLASGFLRTVMIGNYTHIYDNVCIEGVPAVITKENITDIDREKYFGLVPEKWARSSGEWSESQIKKEEK